MATIEETQAAFIKDRVNEILSEKEDEYDNCISLNEISLPLIQETIHLLNYVSHDFIVKHKLEGSHLIDKSNSILYIESTDNYEPDKVIDYILASFDHGNIEITHDYKLTLAIVDSQDFGVTVDIDLFVKKLIFFCQTIIERYVELIEAKLSK